MAKTFSPYLMRHLKCFASSASAGRISSNPIWSCCSTSPELTAIAWSGSIAWELSVLRVAIAYLFNARSASRMARIATGMVNTMATISMGMLSMTGFISSS